MAIFPFSSFFMLGLRRTKTLVRNEGEDLNPESFEFRVFSLRLVAPLFSKRYETQREYFEFDPSFDGQPVIRVEWLQQLNFQVWLNVFRLF